MRAHAVLAVGVYWSLGYNKRGSAAQEYHIALRTGMQREISNVEMLGVCCR